MRILPSFAREERSARQQPASQSVCNKTKQSGLSSQVPQLSLLFNQSRGKMKAKTLEKTATCWLFVVSRNH